MIQTLVGTASVLLAEAGPNNAPPNNPEWGKAAPTGLFVLLVFVVACYFLFRSMNRHIKKVPSDFRPDATPPPQEHLGEAKPAVPPRADDDVDEFPQTRPRLGTPEQLMDEQRAKRRERVAKARARRKP
ncbi:hypothetical protein [Cumulibacter manganitolerans]|uniref:hypothetical protein n=1 Tax=Cumulibacter manganitolerans TaxID=1884992 RepID=UPI001295BDCC|nr:hypothetical protein [Cumulibacter manganitolerans]